MSDITSDDNSSPNKRQKKEPNGEDSEEDKAKQSQSRDENNDKEKDEMSDKDKNKYKDKDEDEEEDSDESKDGYRGDDSEEESDDEVCIPSMYLNKSVVQKLLSQFECPVCMIPVTPPILQCQNGHIICRECHEKLSPKTCPTCRADMPTKDSHNLALVQMAANIGLKFQCKFQVLGCHMSVLLSDKASHEMYCRYALYLCPGLNGQCNWSGNEEELIQHLTGVHGLKIWKRNSFNTNLKKESMGHSKGYKKFAIFHYNNHYFIWCNTKSSFNLNGYQIFTYFLVFVGQQSDANKYKYKCEIVNKLNGNRLIFEGIPNSIRDKSSFTDSECLVFTSTTAKRYLHNGLLTINMLITKA